MTQPSSIEIASATPADVPMVLALITALAEYEKLRHEVVATEASLHQALFGPTPGAEAIIARADGTAAGFGFRVNALRIR